MQTKTYFAGSVPAALEVARKELGADAMLVTSRPSPPEVRSFGRLEVTFAYEAVPAAMICEPPRAGQSPAAARDSGSELEDIRRQIAALRSAIGRQDPASAPSAFEDYLAEAQLTPEGSAPGKGLLNRLTNPVLLQLCASGLEADTAQSLILAASGKTGESGDSVAEELVARLPRKPFVGLKPGESRTLAFLGPPGRGKSTSLVKIAVRHGLAKRIPVKIYSAGAHATGGQEQMARFAALLGVGHHSFESLESLHLALNGDAWKGMILIDTPGLSRSNTSELAAFAAFFRGRPEIEKHLVLRAEGRTAELLHTVAGMSCLQPSRLLFTGLDEALTLGGLLEVLLRTGLPAEFAGTGQEIPKDLEEADAKKWARLTCGERPLLAAAAA